MNFVKSYKSFSAILRMTEKALHTSNDSETISKSFLLTGLRQTLF
ncbi:hypothetical protein D922_01480 [Enterococcus faecalis 06-MB-DW-09]|nr:hypothetical protein D931_00791 [Enterococcus faecium 13.SD.W.09]EPH95052.1 hypothetical protein D922_01480 [Enterococcus faecalis 06-MB-DW-09]